MKIFGIKIYRKKNISLAAPAAEPAKRNRAKISRQILQERRLDIDVAMEEFIQSIMLAKDIERPQRQPLYGIYEKIVERDSHLRSQLRTAHFTIQQSEYSIMQNGKENADLKILFDSSWFTDFITFAVDQEFWGHSLVEFGDIANRQFKNTLLIDRYHVVPEFQSVLIRNSDDVTQGIPYAENIQNWFLVEIGSKRDLGLLLTAAVEIIYKKDARTDWSSFNERFGMPLLAIKTDTTNENELDELEVMAQNFGSNGYVIGSNDTEFDIKQGMGTENGHAKFKDSAQLCDDYISKLINGQTSSSDEKAFVGAALVQERVLNTYTKGRLQRIQRVINDDLIPFLTFHGYPLKDVKFQYVDLLKKDSVPIQTNLDTQKKKTKLKGGVYLKLQTLYNSFEQPENFEQLSISDRLSEIFEKLIKRLHNLADNDKLPEDLLKLDEAKRLLTETAKSFEKAIGKGILSAAYSPDSDFINKLTKSVWVFSGFKTERQLKDISALLIGENGVLKPFNKFRDEVLKLDKDYNANWLNAEYTLAVSASQQAAKWKQYTADGDKYYLQYRTAGDERVRSSHAALNRITLPPSDGFWDEHFPPNGWGCRCSAIQVVKSQYPKTEQSKVDEATTDFFKGNDKIFAYNPGKTEAIFPPKHPYYKVQKERAAKIKNFALELLKSESISENRKIYNNFGKDYVKEGFDDKTGGFFVSHIDHTFDKKTGKYEKEAAKVLSQNGYRVILQSEKGGAEGVKIPDGFINDTLMEIKAIESNTASSVSRNIENSARKKVRYAVLYFVKEYDETIYKSALDKWAGVARKEGLKIEIIKIWKGKIIK